MMGNFRGGGGGGGANCPPGGGGGSPPPQRGVPGMFQRLQQQRGGAPEVKPQMDPRAMPPQATTQPVMGGSPPRGGMPQMQRQLMQAQQMRKPMGGPNPGGSRMPMRGGGRGMY